MPVRWDAAMNEKLLLAIIEQHPEIKADWNKVAEKLGQGLKAGAVREQFRVLRVRSSQATNNKDGGGAQAAAVTTPKKAKKNDGSASRSATSTPKKRKEVSSSDED